MPSLNTENAILSNAIKVDSSYNVGIGGAASGGFKLNVTGTSNFTGVLTASSGSLIPSIIATGSGNGNGIIQLSNSSNYTIGAGTDYGGMEVRVGGSQALLILNNGNVGINQSNPTFRLDVNGTARITGAATFSSSVTASGAKPQFIADGGTSSGAEIILKTSLSSLSTSRRNWSISTEDQIEGDFAIKSSNVAGGNPITSRLVILSNGNIGINASINPQNLLEVSAAGGSQRIRVGTLQNNNNTARFEAITSSTASTANSAWLRVTPGGGFVLGQSSYTKAGGDSGNFANLSAESESSFISVASNGGASFSNSITAGSGLDGNGYLMKATDGSVHRVIDPTATGGIASVNIGAIGTATGDLRIHATNVLFLSNGGNNERMKVTSSQIFIGTNLGLGGRMVINNDGNTAISVFDGTNNGQLLRFFNNGAVQIGSITTNGSVTSFNVTSDYRLKEDLKQIKGLELVNKIKVYDYKWKNNDSRMDGVLAHELAEVLPYAVHGQKDGEEMQGVDYSKIVPILVKAIQEQQAQIEAQQQQINSLINR